MRSLVRYFGRNGRCQELHHEQQPTDSHGVYYGPSSQPLQFFVEIGFFYIGHRLVCAFPLAPAGVALGGLFLTLRATKNGAVVFRQIEVTVDPN